MQADLHIHTNRYSGCSNIDPVAALIRAKEVGLDVIALTEHGIRWADAQVEQLLCDSGVEGLLVVPGQEVACYSPTGAFQGEFLVFGYPKSLGSNKSVDRVVEMTHGEGGVVIAAHPFKKSDHGRGFFGSGHSTVDIEVDGLEIDHPSYDMESRHMARQVMAARGIAGIGCSDAHDLDTIGACRTIFDRAIDRMEALVDAIRSACVRSVVHDIYRKRL